MYVVNIVKDFRSFGDEIIENCYHRSKPIGKIYIDESNFVNPNKCSIKRYVYIMTRGCYLSSDGNDKTLIDADGFVSS